MICFSTNGVAHGALLCFTYIGIVPWVILYIWYCTHCNPSCNVPDEFLVIRKCQVKRHQQFVHRGHVWLQWRWWGHSNGFELHWPFCLSICLVIWCYSLVYLPAQPIYLSIDSAKSLHNNIIEIYWEWGDEKNKAREYITGVNRCKKNSKWTCPSQNSRDEFS